MQRKAVSDDPFKTVISRLEQVEGHGDQREARCPAHDDSSPSLSVARGDSQPIVLHCHAGCTDEDILGALGLSWPDLLADDVTEEEFNKAPWKHGDEVAAYKYLDRDGNHIYTVKRYEHPEMPWKTFRPYLPGKRRAGLGNMKRVLYRLPDVLEAAGEGEVVFVVEGEKDVHTLEQHGFTATTAGSATSWKGRYTEDLEGTRVVIIPDNDQEGQELATEAANDLLGSAEWVRVLELDDVPPDGGDVTDWFARGHGREQLTELVNETSDWERTSDELPQPRGDGQTTDPPEMSPSESDVSDQGHFWSYDRRSKQYKIERTPFMQFLKREGFGKLYAEDDLDSTLVRVEDNIVERTSRERIKDHTIRHVRSLDLEDEGEVVDALLRGANVYFSDALFEFLPALDLDFHRDTADTAFFYYQNGFVEVTAEGHQLHPYDELDGAIWADQIIDREFETLDTEELAGSDWKQHLENVTGQDRERHGSLCTALGYLQHGYKDPAVTKAIIFMDETVSQVAEGRTGKSLTAKALKKTCPTLRIDGRNFSFDNRFAFQEVSLDTQVVDFNDARKRFPFERLFSLITDAFPVERKGQDRVTIPFQDSPKFLLSTNDVIEGTGASFDDRTHQIEFSDYYGTEHTPEDEFGHRLFSDWGEQEWARFDNVMLSCVGYYLQHGLLDYDQVNVDYSQLQQSTCPDFAEWAVDFIEPEREYEKEALWRTFREDYAPDYDDLSKRKFGYWLSDYARIYDLDKHEDRRRVNGSRIRYVTLG